MRPFYTTVVENEYELVETLTLEEGSSFQGTGFGSVPSGVIFIMKRRKINLKKDISM
ncbi:MAG: hypothetical protein IPL25_14405 [Saprospiraceae bacterium]|nr:hypothetical protein [Candidatus Vicinibacter affinis]